MREKKPYVVYSFHQTADAFAFEAFAKENNIPGRLIPVPRVITSGCGMAFRIAEVDFPSYEKIINDAGYPFEEMAHLML